MIIWKNSETARKMIVITKMTSNAQDALGTLSEGHLEIKKKQMQLQVRCSFKDYPN